MFCLWNITGREDIPVVMCMYYIASVALLMVAGLLLHIIWRKKIHKIRIAKCISTFAGRGRYFLQDELVGERRSR